jgi:hypothetical protein
MWHQWHTVLLKVYHKLTRRDFYDLLYLLLRNGQLVDTFMGRYLDIMPLHVKT